MERVRRSGGLPERGPRPRGAVRTCVVTGFGINADDELAAAFELAGSRAQKVHIRDLTQDPSRLDAFHILALPGGFSYGDHLGSGVVFASLLKRHLRPALERFVRSGKPVIGICNGFQVLVKTGILPNLTGGWQPEVSLTHNDNGRFIDRWVALAFNPRSPCVWTQGLAAGELPIRHGEGRFVAASEAVLQRLLADDLVAVRYHPENPNGSVHGIAGICDPTGRVFGLMPHPEAFLFAENHPRWTRESIREGWGIRILRAGVACARGL